MECKGLTFLLGFAVGGLVIGNAPRADVARHIARPSETEVHMTQDQMVGFVPHLVSDWQEGQ